MVQYKLVGETPKVKLGEKRKMSLLEHSVLQLFPLTVLLYPNMLNKLATCL